MGSVLKIITIAFLLMFVLSGCNDEVKKIPVEENVYTFSDGEVVSTWKFPNDSKLIYCLSDGTELMATRTAGPENSIVGDAEPFNELEQAVRDSILDFCEQQETLYHTEEYLEKAYAEYLLQEDKESFRCYYLTQESFVSASNTELVYCTTTVNLPLNQLDYEEYSVTQAFDRKNGSLVGSWDLFSGSEEEVKEALLSHCSENPEILAVLYEDFKPEYVQFHSEGYIVRFPAKTTVSLLNRIGEDGNGPYLKDANPNFGFAVDGQYTEKVLSVLKPGSIPDPA